MVTEQRTVGGVLLDVLEKIINGFLFGVGFIIAWAIAYWLGVRT